MSTLTSSGAGSGNYDRLDRLADEFAERFRRGERPSLKEYVERYPELADDFLREHRADSALRAAQAGVHLRVAKIHREVGDPESERRAAEEAVRLYETLAREKPDDLDVQQGLIDAASRASHHSLAIRQGERLVQQYSWSHSDARATAWLCSDEQWFGASTRSRESPVM
jgi:hypothetical protein